METLATNLARLRDSHDLLKSQKSIAEKAGVDQRTVGRILNKEHAATLTQVERLAGAFGVEPWQLLAPKLGTFLYELSQDQRIVPVKAPVREDVAPSGATKQQPLELASSMPEPAPAGRQPPSTLIVSSGTKHKGRIPKSGAVIPKSTKGSKRGGA